MNRLAGIVADGMSTAERERCVRDALAEEGGKVTVLHPAPWLTVGYTAESYLLGVRKSGKVTSIVYGSAYCQKGCVPEVRVEDAGSAAAHLVQRVLDRAEAPTATLFGSYLAALIDGDGDCLSIAGDPSGNRNPFVTLRGDGLAFASHPLTCARLGGAVTLDREYEEFFLIYGFYPDGRTTYAGVRQLTADQTAAWSLSEGAAIQRLPKQKPVIAELPSGNDRDCLIDALYSLMLECTGDQLCDDERVGVLLGGFDSALVAALLQRAGKRVTTYSFRYPENAYNQPHTDTLQRYLGIEHVWVDIEPGLIAEEMRSYGEKYVQPTNWLNYVVQTTHVAKRMRTDGIRCAYSGDGCDIMFLGFPGTYQRTRIFAGMPHLPVSVVEGLLSLLAWPALERGLGHPYRMALNLLRATRLEMPERAFLTFRIFDEISLLQMERTPSSVAAEPIQETARRLARPHRQASLQRIGYISKALISPSKIKQLAVTDCHGVTIHAPYMHPAIKAFLAKVPDGMLRGAGQSSLKDLGKALLIDMARRYRLLPDEIILQPKVSAVDSPIDGWYSAQLREDCRVRLKTLPFELPERYSESLLRDRLAERLYKRYLGSTAVCSDGLSLLLTYAAFSAYEEPASRP